MKIAPPARLEEAAMRIFSKPVVVRVVVVVPRTTEVSKLALATHEELEPVLSGSI